MTVSTMHMLDVHDMGDLPPLTLLDVDRLAALQRRYDHKYLVDRGRLPELIASLGPSVHVLQVDGRRAGAYTSVYFDTPDLLTYRDHLKRRRRRFKIRTREYPRQGSLMLEVKCKGHRGQTVKHRWPHTSSRADELDEAAEALIEAAVRREYGFEVHGGLAPVAVTRFDRVTLVVADAGERVTVDLDLSIDANGKTMEFGAGLAVVEIKSPRLSSPSARAVHALGVRPERMSKYCVGVAAAHDDIRGNPWMPVVQRLRPRPGIIVA